MSISRTKVVTLLVAIAVSLIPLVELWHSHTVYSGADLQFHINRIHELVNQVKAGKIDLISYASFGSVGSGVQYFYPSLTLIPSVIVFLVIKSGVAAYYVSLFIYGLITFWVANYSLQAMIKDKWLSLFGSIALSLSAYRVFSIIGASAFGEFIAIAWIPLIALGYYRVVKHQSWRTLWLAITLMGYTHLLSLVLSVLVLAIITLVRMTVSFRQVLSELPYYIKAALSFIVSFLAFLVPFMILSKHNSIISPDATLHYQWAMSFAGYYVSSIRLLANRTLGFVYVVLLIGMAIFWKKLSTPTKIYFWIGMALTFVASSDFPWFLLENTAVATLQFPYRFLPFAILFLTLSSVLAVRDAFRNPKANRRDVEYAVIIFLSLLMVGTTLASVHEYKKQINGSYKVEVSTQGHLNYSPFAAYRVTNKTFDKQFNNNFDTYGAFDYWTKPASANKDTILKHEVLSQTGHQVISTTTTTKNGMSYRVQNDTPQKLDFPFIKYSGINYAVTIDGHQTNFSLSKRGTLAAYVETGEHQVNIQARVPLLFILVFFMSVFATLGIVIFPFWTNHS